METAGLRPEDTEGAAVTPLREALLWEVDPTRLPLQQLGRPPGLGFQTLCSCQEKPLWGPAFRQTQLGKAATQQLCVTEHTPSPGNN